MDFNFDNQIDSDSEKLNDTSPEKNVSNGIQLRTSARVLKKQKLDIEANNAGTSDKKEERGETGGLVECVGSSEARSEAQKCGEWNKGGPVQCPTTPTTGGKRATPVRWLSEEKTLFFEALNMMGKDFEGIEKYMALKIKKRCELTAPPVKSKHQLQCFYRQMCAKISKYITFPECVKKSTQELYSLINFGELRKRMCLLNERNALKLKELIFCGSTQIRTKGKTWRVKTPVCRALRKLNQLEESRDEVRLPGRVEVVLTPRENRDRHRVESVGHNSRLRTSLPSDLPLNSLLNYLKTRWTFPPHLSEEWKIGAEETGIYVGPKPGVPLVQTKYKCGQVVTSTCISLVTHQAKQGLPLGPLHTLGLAPPCGGRVGKSWAKWHQEGEPQVDSLAHQMVLEPVEEESDSAPRKQTKADFETRVRSGWTIDPHRRTRIADLYLIFGKGCRLELEYWWEGASGGGEAADEEALRRLVGLARLWAQPARNKACWACGLKPPPPVPPAPLPHLPQPSIDHTVEVKMDVQECAVSGVGLVAAPCTSFRKPLLPTPAPARPSPDTLTSLQLRPKYCNRRGRYRQKSVVVQRMLPLLPKVTTPSGATMVTVQVVRGSATSSQPFPKPIAPKTSPSPHLQGSMGVGMRVMVEANPLKQTGGSEPVSEESEGKGGGGVGPGLPETEKVEQLPGEETEPPLASPLLSQDPLSAPASSSDSSHNTFSGLLGGGTESELVTPMASPTRILKEGESQWLNSEVADFSFSSFLGHLESPLKSNGLLEDTRLSVDVDSQLQSLMMESSLDYTAKFADLAAKIADGNVPGQTTSSQVSE